MWINKINIVGPYTQKIKLYKLKELKDEYNNNIIEFDSCYRIIINGTYKNNKCSKRNKKTGRNRNTNQQNKYKSRKLKTITVCLMLLSLID